MLLSKPGWASNILTFAVRPRSDAIDIAVFPSCIQYNVKNSKKYLTKFGNHIVKKTIIPQTETHKNENMTDGLKIRRAKKEIAILYSVTKVVYLVLLIHIYTWMGQ